MIKTTFHNLVNSQWLHLSTMVNSHLVTTFLFWLIYCFMQKCHIHIDFKLPFIVSIKLKSSQGRFLSILNSQVHSVHSSNYSTLSNHRHVKKITCLAFSLAFSPFSNVVVQNYQLWWALLSSSYGFQLVDLTSQLAPGHMKAAYLELPVRKPLPEEFVANPRTHHIML